MNEEMKNFAETGKVEEALPKKELKYVDLPKYDAAKKYRWEPDTRFLLTGEEFGVILNSLRAILNSPDAQRILLAERANLAVENSIARAVEVGLVKEDVPQAKSPN